MHKYYTKNTSDEPAGCSSSKSLSAGRALSAHLNVALVRLLLRLATPCVFVMRVVALRFGCRIARRLFRPNLTAVGLLPSLLVVVMPRICIALLVSVLLLLFLVVVIAFWFPRGGILVAPFVPFALFVVEITIMVGGRNRVVVVSRHILRVSLLLPRGFLLELAIYPWFPLACFSTDFYSSSLCSRCSGRS